MDGLGCLNRRRDPIRKRRLSRLKSLLPLLLLAHNLIGCPAFTAICASTHHLLRSDHRLDSATTLTPASDLPETIQSDTTSYSLLSWNLLAPLFCTAQKYSRCDPEHLSWPFRCKSIVQKLRESSATIVFLQEVQIDTWERDLLPHFTAANYTAILQNVTKDHPVACATLVDNNVFRVVETESRSRALICVLEQAVPVESATAVPTFILANVHLEAGMDQDDKRFCQVKSMLNRLRKYYVKSTQRQAAAPHPPRILVAGDFNMLPDNRIHSLLVTGIWEPEESRNKNVKMSHAVKKRVAANQFPFLPLRDVLQGEACSNDDASSARNDNGNSTLPQSNSAEQEERLHKTFAGGSVLDYVYVSAPFDSASPWIVDNRTMLSSPREENNRFHCWPSEDNPSDHLPVGVRFSLN